MAAGDGYVCHLEGGSAGLREPRTQCMDRVRRDHRRVCCNCRSSRAWFLADGDALKVRTFVMAARLSAAMERAGSPLKAAMRAAVTMAYDSAPCWEEIHDGAR